MRINVISARETHGRLFQKAKQFFGRSSIAWQTSTDSPSQFNRNIRITITFDYGFLHCNGYLNNGHPFRTAFVATIEGWPLLTGFI